MRSWHSLKSPFGTWHTAGGRFSPAALFALAEPGAWYDPSDLSTLFQDTAGTQPVTAAGQSVALVLDKSRGLVLGSELVTNGDFSVDANWDKGTGWTISGGVATKVAGTAANLGQVVSPSLTVGRTYRVTFSVTVTAGSVDFLFTGGSTTFAATGITTTRTVSVLAVALGANNYFVFTANAAFVGTIDNISVRELPGNHATQSILASRPTYGVVPATGRRNLLTFTEQFDNVAWQKQVNVTVTPNADTDPNGALLADRLNFAATTNDSIFQSVNFSAGQTCTFSVYVKGTAGQTIQVSVQHANGGNTFTPVTFDGSWQRVSATATASTGGFANIAVDSAGANPAANCLVWGAQLELGSTATAYQRVVSAFDVTEAGVASLGYLGFDGTDDFLITPTITPGTDKAQVFAGVRKLSDAAVGIIYESSVNAGLNAGTIQLYNAIDLTIQGRARGSNDVSLITSALSAAPLSFVATLQGDIAGDTSSIRVNGVSRASSSADQGTGNFTAQPLYIGRRGGTTLPFNGNIFGLVVRFGANLDAGTISSTERWMGAKTGVTL